MASVKKYIKEAENLASVIENYDPEKKREFLEKQLESLEGQMFRSSVDIEIGKKYIKHGEDTKEEQYVNTGEQKVQETVQSMRALALSIEKVRDLISKL